MKKLTKFFGPVMMLLILPAVVVQSATLDGYIYYKGTTNKPMENTLVRLNPGGFWTTTIGAYYSFADVPEGPCTITLETCNGWCGLDNEDVLLAKKLLLVPGFPLTDLQKRALDVNFDGVISNVDVVLLSKRFYEGKILSLWRKPYELIWGDGFGPGWHGYSPSWILPGISITLEPGSNTAPDIFCLFSGDLDGDANLQLQFTDMRDQKVYPTVLIGNQCWMQKNLNVGTMINGSSNPTNSNEIEKYCYSNDPANCTTYGGLYQWEEMTTYSNDPIGICPGGWHIPTHEEWCTLETFVNTDPSFVCAQTGWRTGSGGGKLKETGTIHWNAPNTGATNASGFTALGAGARFENLVFGYLKDLAYFWTSDQFNSTNGKSRILYYANSKIYLGDDQGLKLRGYSVRCIK